MNLSNLGFGTAAIGRPMYINIRSQKSTPFDLHKFKVDSTQILENAYQSGIRYFDTAPGYGISEDLLIEWLKSKDDPRIEIATKWGYEYVANFQMDAKEHEVKEHSLEMLNKQWKSSKKLLPHLTTLQIHSATFETGVLENQAVLNRLAELKAKHGLRIGVTTTGDNQVEVLKKALAVEVEGLRLFDVFQVTYNVLDQSIGELKELLKGKRVIVKEALANARVFRNNDYPLYTNLYDSMESLANKYKVGVDAIALRFCMQTLDCFQVLSGANEVLQVEQNLKAESFSLNEEEIQMLKNLQIAPRAYWAERKQLTWN